MLEGDAFLNQILNTLDETLFWHYDPESQVQKSGHPFGRPHINHPVGKAKVSRSGGKHTFRRIENSYNVY